MNIEDFCRLHSGDVRDIQAVTQGWNLTEIHELLDAACEHGRQGESLRGVIGDAVILGDGLCGGTLLDHLKADPDVSAKFKPNDLEALFDMGYHTKHVDTIFKRVFGST